MKIALVHIRQAASGGTERHLNALAAHLAERGDLVSIVCRTHERAPHPRVRIVELAGLAVGGAWRMQAFARDVETHVTEEGYDLVYGLGRTWTHDVVRLGGGCHATYVALAEDAPPAHATRAMAARILKHRLAQEIEALALRPSACRMVVVGSRLVKRDVMRRYGIPPELVRVIHNGVDVARFHPKLRATAGRALRRAIGFDDADRVALFIGTGYARKGLSLVVRACVMAMERERALQLLVVGHDAEIERHRAIARDVGLGARVHFVGHRRDVEACFAAADLYVLPTRYDPFANTTLEAMASGLPVVTSAFNGASELVDDGRCGTVLEGVGDPESIAAALTTWSDRDRAREAGPAARAIAERHSEAAVVAESAGMLDELLAEKRAAV